jgi:transposase
MTGVEAPTRFSRSSAVGAYFGMTPRRYQSGEVDQAMRLEMRRWDVACFMRRRKFC